MKTVRSMSWAYTRIIAGTIIGGIAGFYVMHRVEISYKAKWEERLKRYQEEKLRKEKAEIQAEDSNLYFAESSPPK